MHTLSRASASLLIAGGALMTTLLVVMTMAPESPAIYGFFIVAPAIGVGVLGMMLPNGAAAGRLGRLSAWIAGVGGVAVVLLGAFAIASGRFSTTAGLGGDDPMALPFAVTSTAWMLGSLGFALALVRRRVIPALGGWLVLVGTVTAIVLGTILGAVAPELSALSALPFGLGWAVVGWNARVAR